MNTKKLSIGLLTALCVALCALLAWFIIPQDVSAYADDETEDEIPVSLLVNGQIVTDVLSFTYGDSFVVEVSYNGNVYEPVLYLEESGAAFTQDHNELTVKQGSVLGETEIEVSRTFPDGREYVGILTIDIYTTVDLRNILVTDNERVMTVDLPDNVAYVDATVYMQDYVGSRSLRLYDGDVITEVLPESPHGICGLEFFINNIGIKAKDNAERTSIQNDLPINLQTVTQLRTVTLTGAGTSSYPYEISNQEEFEAITDYDTPLTTIYFKQTQDITLSTSFDQFNFYGNYNGTILNKYKISINNIENTYSGMFIDNYGTIRNIQVYVNNLSTTTSSYCGTICSENKSSGQILNTDVFGADYVNNNSLLSWAMFSADDGDSVFVPHITYAQNSYAGGITGKNNGTINGCRCFLRASSTKYFGGIAYRNADTGSILYCEGFNLIKGVIPSTSVVMGSLVALNLGSLTVFTSGGNNSSYAVIYTIFSSIPNNTVTPYVGGAIAKNYNDTLNITSSAMLYLSVPRCYYCGSTLPSTISTTYIKNVIAYNYEY